MENRMLPTELWLMDLSDERVRYVKPVSSLDIYDGATVNLHPEGLYSVDIFGHAGTYERDITLSYIDCKVPILMPKIYKDLIRLKGLYEGILSGKETAIFDEELKDFVSDNSERANTGYWFFMSRFKDIVFKKTKSPSRHDRVEFIEKYRNRPTTTRAVVIPAGLRDIEIDNGQTKKHEINDLYYRLISISNTIFLVDEDSPVYDLQKYSLTKTYLEIHDLLESMLSGKKGFLLNKFGSRTIHHGTRNVLSAMSTSSAVLGAKNAPSFDSTVFGFFQVIKSLEPIAIHVLKTRYLSNVFTEGESNVYLINKKTLKRELVTINPLTRDYWTTKEGLNRLINSFVDVEARHRYVTVEDNYYPLLIYKGPDQTFKILYDIDELPSHLDKKYVTPITLCELLYLHGYDLWNNYICNVVRYPIADSGSNYPSRIYVKTTVVSEVRKELNDQFEIDEDSKEALEFPRSDVSAFYNTMSPHTTKLVGLGADFDGDTGSGTTVMTVESLAELNRFLKSRNAWVSPAGRMRASCAYDTTNLVVQNLTRRA